MLFLAALLVSSGSVRFIFFPELESNSIRASLEFPVGTPFNTTKAAADRIVEAAYIVNEQVGGTSFRAMSVTIGGRSRTSGGPGGGGSRAGS